MTTEPTPEATDELTAGVIEINEDDLAIATEVFERMCADPEFDKAIALTIKHGFSDVEAPIQVRRHIMSLCMGKQLGIDMVLLAKFEKHPTWQTLVDTCIEAYDEVNATRERAK